MLIMLWNPVFSYAIHITPRVDIGAVIRAVEPNASVRAVIYATVSKIDMETVTRMGLVDASGMFSMYTDDIDTVFVHAMNDIAPTNTLASAFVSLNPDQRRLPEIKLRVSSG